MISAEESGVEEMTWKISFALGMGVLPSVKNVDISKGKSMKIASMYNFLLSCTSSLNVHWRLVFKKKLPEIARLHSHITYASIINQLSINVLFISF